MIQQFRDVLRLRTAANLSEGREMIDYADYRSVKLTCNPKNTSVDVAMKAQGCTPLYGLCGHERHNTREKF